MKDLTKQEHYTNNGIEPIEIMRKNFSHDEFIGFCKGNVLKYLLRYKDKNGLEDLEKARIYLNWLIDELVAEDCDNGYGVQLTLFDCEPIEKPSADESKETKLTIDDKTSNFEKYLAWKQVLDELRKGE